ncbi:hypothetical protein SBV1_2960003 [Verrucomicrobia bacterium]|nr:hypothetical protein SBV1_2960003 [Verrucomicrobiota bacterium]
MVCSRSYHQHQEAVLLTLPVSVSKVLVHEVVRVWARLWAGAPRRAAPAANAKLNRVIDLLFIGVLYATAGSLLVFDFIRYFFWVEVSSVHKNSNYGSHGFYARQSSSEAGEWHVVKTHDKKECNQLDLLNQCPGSAAVRYKARRQACAPARRRRP